MENDHNNHNNRHGNGNNNGDNTGAEQVGQAANHNNAAANHIIDTAALQMVRTCVVEPFADLQVIPMKTC